MPLPTGQVLNNRYRIVKLLGQGGFGAVYRTWDLNLKRPFALKENLDLSAESIRQFEREASFLAELHHPNLPRVIDYFLIPDLGQYLVMDYIEGQTLEEILDRSDRSLVESQVVPWMIQICDALTYLHDQEPPIIHRDIKPANIKVTPDGKAVLVDFGIAKTYFGKMQTTVGARAVTEGYSPPEQYGFGITDGRSDVYALGATLYHALTGQRPVESVRRRQGSDLLPPRSLNPQVSLPVETAILKAMALDTERRFRKAEFFKEALESPVHIQRAPVVESVEYQVERTARVDDTLISVPPQIAPHDIVPPKESKSPGGNIVKIGFIFVVVMFVITAGLGGLWTYFTYLKGTPTPTPTQTLVIATELPTSTIQPTMSPTDAPSPSPTVPSSTFTPIPTDTPTPLPPTRTASPTTMFSEWTPCPGTYPSRLHVGDKAYVSFDPPWKNNVRANPSLSAQKLGSLEPGEKMDVLDGPFCADNMVWWRVQSLLTPLTGWTSEGDIDNYWLIPIP